MKTDDDDGNDNDNDDDNDNDNDDTTRRTYVSLNSQWSIAILLVLYNVRFVSKCLLSGPATVNCEHSFFVFTSRPSLEIKVTTVRELHRLKRKKERKKEQRPFLLSISLRLSSKTQFDDIRFVLFSLVSSCFFATRPTNQSRHSVRYLIQ